MKGPMLTLAWLLLVTLPLHAQSPGSLDASFGTAGIVTTAMGPGDDYATDIALQPDGKILVAGNSSDGSIYHMAAACYNADGSLDALFGANGQVTTEFDGGECFAQACILQPDGRLVLAGSTWNNGFPAFALVRLLEDGSLDDTFGTGGKVITSIGSIDDAIWSLLIQPDGRLIAVGYSASGSDYRIALARYLPNGSLDGSFGTNGSVITSVGNDVFGIAAALQGDGKIVVTCGAFTLAFGDIALLRYLPNGQLDPAFGNNGVVLTDVAGEADVSEGAAVQPDGRIVVAGYTLNSSGDYDMVALRYMPNGTRDMDFGTNGISIIEAGVDSYCYSVALQPNGRIVLGGTSWNADNYDHTLVRLSADGALDASFGNNGRTVTPVCDGENGGEALKLQPDGRILLAGYALIDGNSDLSLLRYLGDPVSSVAELALQNADATISPNPMRDMALLEFTLGSPARLSCTVLDASGRELRRVFGGSIRAAGTHREWVDLSMLSAGAYTLLLTDGHSAREVRMVKE